MKNKNRSPFRRFSLIIAAITIACTFMGLLIAGLFLEILSVFWSFEIAMVLSGCIAYIASWLYVCLYDTATLDLKTGNFKASADFSDAKEPFILITTVNPLDKPKEEEE